MKPFLILSISVLVILLAGAFEKTVPVFQQEISQNEVPNAVNRSPSTVSRPQIWVENAAAFYEGETIELHFAAPNPPFLGIVDPAGHFFYLVFPAENAFGNLVPFVESRDFAGLKTLKINTRTFVADPYIYEVYDNRPVFTKTGNYTFIMGENLHVDDPELLENVVVKYVHALRPAVVSANVAMN